MSGYGAVYEKQFVRNLQRYSSLKARIRSIAETQPHPQLFLISWKVLDRFVIEERLILANAGCL